MKRFISPLRYPGGKGRLAPYIAELLQAQPKRPRAYAEPFAGGAGAALRLLVGEEVQHVHLNDINPGIAAFWRCVFHNTEALATKIEGQTVDLEAWNAASQVYRSPNGQPDLELGFATFMLNRCNRSGILTARPIGGLQQTGHWKIDARFNRSDLAQRIRLLGRYRHRVTISEMDGREFIKTLDSDGSSVLVYVDPPYLGQGDDLYLNSLGPEDHQELAQILLACRIPWLLTYDVNEQVTQRLYPTLNVAEFNMAHTAHKQSVGAEYVVYSPNMVVPSVNLVPRANTRWLQVSATTANNTPGSNASRPES